MTASEYAADADTPAGAGSTGGRGAVASPASTAWAGRSAPAHGGAS